jgi:hypothetical protein
MKSLPGIKRYLFGWVLFSALAFTSKPCSAQSIIGKWNQISAKQYLTDEGAKAIGKPFVETDMSTIGKVVYEFKTDQTFIMTSTSSLGGDPRIYKGSWSLSGNELSMSPETSKTASIKSTITFQSGDLIIETLHPESTKTRKVVLTFKKL